MVIVIFLLVMIILGLGTYLFFVRQELKKITRSIHKMKQSDSNLLLHQSVPSKQLNTLMIEVNQFYQEMKAKEIFFGQQNKGLKKMMMNISHDLRTPLTSALGYIDIVINSELPEEEKEKELRIIEERLKKLEELITSFFDFSQILLQRNSMPEEEENIIAILEGSIANFYEDYQREKRKIVFSKNLTKIKVSINRKLITRVFDNLIGNALKHGVGDLEITIEKRKSVQIVFQNELKSGHLEIDRIFEEFYTEDISRTKGSTGLGLAIAKEFTEQLGGTIHARKEKKYLKIILEFPGKD